MTACMILFVDLVHLENKTTLIQPASVMGFRYTQLAPINGHKELHLVVLELREVVSN